MGYTNDYAGRMLHMATWQNFASGTVAATTTWAYDSERGWLTKKVYQGETDNSDDYEYTDAGRLWKRHWERTVGGQPLATTYAYKGTEALAYEKDGNLTSDGRWTSTWNALNRLTAMESKSTAPDASKHKFELCRSLPTSRVSVVSLTPQLIACYKAQNHHLLWFPSMRCPKCGCQDDKVVDSRATREGATIRRRRECISCGHRFTTYEEIEHEGWMVLKRDGRHEEFSREKLLGGIKKACQKRPVSPKVMEDLAEKIVDAATTKFEREIPSDFIGRMVMEGLSEIDDVAYVRFASVYRRFQEATDFVHEVKKLEAQQ